MSCAIEISFFIRDKALGCVQITQNHDNKRCHFDIDGNSIHKNANERQLKQMSEENYD